MLSINKSTSISGHISIDGQPVVYLSASIESGDGFGANITKSIVDQVKYMENKETIRSDVAEFEKVVYGLEDDAMLDISSK